MIRCLAIDDEPLALSQIRSYIERTPVLELVGTCQSAMEAAQVLSVEKVDVLFIDINMPDLTGLDFVRTLLNPPMVVFTTAYSEYAIEGYKVNAVDYLLKPFGRNEFQRVTEKLLKLYRLQNPSGAKDRGDETLFIKSSYKNIRVRISDITHVESMSEYLKIYLDNQPHPIVALLSMKKMEEYLPQDRFMRVHRSFMVCLDRIREVQKGRIILLNGSEVPIGDLYKDAFMSYLASRSLGK